MFTFNCSCRVVSGVAIAQNFIIDISEGSNLPVPVNRVIPVHFVYTGEDASIKGFKVFALQFASDQEAVSVDILMKCEDKAPVQNQPVALTLDDARTASFCLRVPELSGDGKYSGYLMLFPDNKEPESQKTFTLSRVTPSAATLTTDRQVASVDLGRLWAARFSAPWDSLLTSVALIETSEKGPSHRGENRFYTEGAWCF